MGRILVAPALLLPLTGCGLFGSDEPVPGRPDEAGVRAVDAKGADAAGLRWTFDDIPAGLLPTGWTVEATNPSGDLAEWTVKAGAGAGRVLAIEAIHDASNRVFNLCWTRGAAFKDGTLSVRVRADSGAVDQGGGPVWRVRDAKNYYLARYNPLERNFRLYCVKDGVRTQLADAGGLPIPAGTWFTVKVIQQGDAIACELDGKRLLEATDATFPGPGGVGVWSKADAVTSFDDLSVTPE